MGQHAEVTVDGGRISVTRFGRTSELNVAAAGASCADCPAEYVARYGRTGLANGPDGVVGVAAWSNITFGAHYPYVAETAQVLYPQSGGQPIDGVFVMDPYVIQALMQYTGPIEVPELGVTVQPDDAANFIMRDQYVIAGDDQADRVEALDTLGRSVIQSLLTGSLPNPAVIARDLGPLASERRLLLWTDVAEEQDLLARTRLLGAIPDLGANGGFSVAVNNSGESKIDLFLEREVDTRIEAGPDGGRRLVADVTLTNTSPASGLPDVVIGNNYGFPTGTSMLFVTFYGPDGLIEATREAREISPLVNPEAGWTAYGFDDRLVAGQSVTYRLVFALGPPSPPEASGGADPAPVVWWQPLAERRP